MKGFVAGAERAQASLLPECLEDWVDESNPVRVIDAFVGALDLADLGFYGVEPAATGRPSYHPSTHLKLYIYGYLYRVQSSRRLEQVRVPANITLVPLPPYSPELNPVEWLWEVHEGALSLAAAAQRLRRHRRRRLQGLEPPSRRDRSHHLAVLTPLDHGGQTLGALV